MTLLRYIASLSIARQVLWCYLIWYLCVVFLYFDPSPVLWVSSLGMSGIIGLALQLSTAGKASPNDGWTTFRLFLMPFCVSSYSALIKGKGFILIFPPAGWENGVGICCLVAFLAVQRIVKLKMTGEAADRLEARDGASPIPRNCSRTNGHTQLANVGSPPQIPLGKERP